MIVVCCQVERSVSDDLSYRGVLPSLCMCVFRCDLECWMLRRRWPSKVCCTMEKKCYRTALTFGEKLRTYLYILTYVL